MGELLTPDEARQRNLPGSDTYNGAHICYLNDAHAEWTAVYLNIEALKAFRDTVAISERSALSAHQTEIQDWIAKGALAAGLPMLESEHYWKALEYRNYENLKIACGLEIHLKARLLARGFVVHRVNRHAPFAQLAARQLTDPITRDELLRGGGFRYDGKQNNLLGVGPKSIGFSVLVEEESYRRASGLDDGSLDQIDGYRHLRNVIHLPGMAGAASLASFNADIEGFLVPFINREIVMWSNATITHRGFTFGRLQDV